MNYLIYTFTNIKKQNIKTYFVRATRKKLKQSTQFMNNIKAKTKQHFKHLQAAIFHIKKQIVISTKNNTASLIQSLY